MTVTVGGDSNTRSGVSQSEHSFDVNPWIEQLYSFPWHTEIPHIESREPHMTPPPPSQPSSSSTPRPHHKLTERQRSVLEFIEFHMRDRGYPPSVREIGSYIGVASPSTVHSHLKTLQREGYLHRDPSKPRAIRVVWDPTSGASEVERRPVRHVPLVGSVAAGTDVLAAEHIEETLPVPADFAGEGDLFMLKVRGDSMVDVGILDGDYVVATVQEEAKTGDVVVAGIPGDEATVKTYSVDNKTKEIVLLPANENLEPMRYPAEEVHIFGRVVTVMRRL